LDLEHFSIRKTHQGEVGFAGAADKVSDPSVWLSTVRDKCPLRPSHSVPRYHFAAELNELGVANRLIPRCG
jgi:hypothetical protein